ncbi:MAG: DNA-binding response regulator [Myxococcaceae bacterium]|nr:DNA-binding response regulator [Myxococcaceae bacterium]
MTERILVIEDDRALGAQIVGHLRSAGYEPAWLTDGDAFADERPADYRLVILDLMLPGVSGMDILKRLRASSDVPVLILSARNDTPGKVSALRLGADDYMTKPFWPEELLERVGARLRRPALRRAGAIELGPVRVDLEARAVSVDGRAVELTRVEFDLLVALAQRPGRAVTRRWLVENVLDPDREGTERTLDVHMSRLRKKLGACGVIATVWGVGYRVGAEGGA